MNIVLCSRIKLNFLDQVAKFWELQGSSLKVKAYININGVDRADAMCQYLGDDDDCDDYYRTDSNGINYLCMDAPTS